MSRDNTTKVGVLALILFWLVMVPQAVCVAMGPMIFVGPKPAGTKWDVRERIHDHATWFLGAVEARTEQEALVIARKRHGAKAYVVPYYREGIAQRPLSWDDMGCYQHGAKR